MQASGSGSGSTKWAHVYMSRGCPHCVRMQTETLEPLGQTGFWVARTFLDTELKDDVTGEYVDPVVRAISTVPTTYIYDSGAPTPQEPVVLQGVHTKGELLEALGVSVSS